MLLAITKTIFKLKTKLNMEDKISNQDETANSIKGAVMRSFIVLKTGGKNEDAYQVSVQLFATKEEAEKYCKENTDESMDEKYWQYCEIIEHGKEYEIARYKNYA